MVRISEESENSENKNRELTDSFGIIPGSPDMIPGNLFSFSYREDLSIEGVRFDYPEKTLLLCDRTRKVYI